MRKHITHKTVTRTRGMSSLVRVVSLWHAFLQFLLEKDVILSLVCKQKPPADPREISTMRIQGCVHVLCVCSRKSRGARGVRID